MVKINHFGKEEQTYKYIGLNLLSTQVRSKKWLLINFHFYIHFKIQNHYQVMTW